MTHTATDVLIIRCPVCSSDGAGLRHDVRSSLLYFCHECGHEWQIDPAEEPLQADLDSAITPPGCTTADAIYASAVDRAVASMRLRVVKMEGRR